MSKIIFIPFSNNEGNTGERGEARQWIQNGGAKKVAVYTGSSLPEIKGAGVFDEIYVVGHGAAGDPTIDSDTGVSLKYDTVAGRLIASGLRKSYAGCIKIYACRGGEATDKNLSFAKLFAVEMIKKQSRYLCSVYGYVGSLTANMLTQEEATGSGDDETLHKWSRKHGDDASGRVRASSRRKRFYGLI